MKELEVPCQHIADYYQRKWEEQPCIGYNLLRQGYQAWADKTSPRSWNNLYPIPNYKVVTQCWNGRKVTFCDTPEQAWEAAGNRAFGGLYSVESPAGLNVYDFVPF